MPARIQRERTPGWRAPAGAIYVGRGPGIPWGNEVRVGPGITPAAATAAYRDRIETDTDLADRARAQLGGHDLMCWCRPPEPGRPDHCHAAVLLDVANRPHADLSPCGRYRYLLYRRWAPGPIATYLMLNPSTADATRDDATTRRCRAFAAASGHGALIIVNLYAYRATDPRTLAAAGYPVGDDTDHHLMRAARLATSTGGQIVAAWGAHAPAGRITQVLRLPGLHRLHALATTQSGQPRHPLYLPARHTPQPWVPPSAPQDQAGRP
jgi:hypothetical protein